MSAKQDRQGVRTASELERKYNFGQKFAEIMGIATDARDSVDQVESTLRGEMADQITSITRNTEQILMSALQSYVETADYEEFQETMKSELAVLASEISMKFTTLTDRLTTVEGDTVEKFTEIYKHISFDADGITIGSSENAIRMNLDNDQLVFSKNGIEIVRLDIDNFTPVNVYIKAGGRLRLGNFAWDVFEDGVPAFAKVGG